MVTEEPYPESAKLLAVSEESQSIGAFLDDIPYELGEWIDCEKYHNLGGICALGSHFVPLSKSIEAVLAAYFRVDLNKVETERRAMLEALRSQ